MALDINNYDPAFLTGAQVQTGDIADSSVTLAKLASGIKPARIITLAGTTSAYAGGGTSNAFTVTGLLATDAVSAVIRASTNAVSIAKATPTADTLTVVFSADPGSATTVDYIVARLAA